MNAVPRTKQRWDTLQYHQIVSAHYRDGELVVGFADGTEARVSPQCLISPDAPTPDWSSVRVEEFHIVAPSPAGDVEIPWDVIRVHTDPAFDAYWAGLAAERASSATPSASRVPPGG
jgi:hypothetical protein